MQLVAGANTVLPTEFINIDISLNGTDLSKLDFSAYLLSHTTKKIRGDDDMIFYNQLNNKKSTLILSEKSRKTTSFAIDLKNIDPEISKIAICATVADSISNFSIIDQLVVDILSARKSELAQGKLSGAGRLEAALIIGEVYRHQQGWKFRLVGQGFNGGLKPLAEYFGVEIKDDNSPASSDSRPVPTPSSLPPPIPNPPSVQQGQQQEPKKSFLASLIDMPLKALDKRRKLKEFKLLLIDYLRDGVLTEQEKGNLNSFCAANNLTVNEAMSYSQAEVNDFLQMTLASITSDKEISAENKKLIENLCSFLKADNQALYKIRATINRIEQLQNIRAGNVQPCQAPGIITKNGEIVFCQLDNMIYYLKKDQGQTGKVHVTSDNIVFTGYGFGANAPLSGLLSLVIEDGVVYITSKTKKSTFTLIPPDDDTADLLEAYIEQAAKRFHRKMDFNGDQKQTRHIPQSVKLQVWENCGGKCVQCGAKDYLEFDHIIPFSKGGANTVNNLQILCRKCNLAKRDRI